MVTPTPSQKPTVSQTQVAFVYAGDLWIVARQGGDARRLSGILERSPVPMLMVDGQRRFIMKDRFRQLVIAVEADR